MRLRFLVDTQRSTFYERRQTETLHKGDQRMTELLTVGEVARRTTLESGRYVAPWKVGRCLQKLHAEGMIPKRLVGRQRVILGEGHFDRLIRRVGWQEPSHVMAVGWITILDSPSTWSHLSQSN